MDPMTFFWGYNSPKIVLMLQMLQLGAPWKSTNLPARKTRNFSGRGTWTSVVSCVAAANKATVASKAAQIMEQQRGCCHDQKWVEREKGPVLERTVF